MPRSAPRLVLLATLLLLTGLPAIAHNGAVAIAVPVKEITVDGDLSDWPRDLVQYPIRHVEAGDSVQDEADLQGHFRIGYSEEENALYIAVESHDESTVVDPASSADWSAQDGCEIYIGLVHGRENAWGEQYFVRGESLGVPGSEARMADFAAAVQRDSRSQRYEWRIDIERLGEGNTRVRDDMSLGMDVVLCDRDDDGSFSWVAWGTGVDKRNNTTRLGDVVLVAGPTRTGTVSGKAAWASGQPIAYVPIRVESQRTDRLWVHAETDREGEFAVAMPAGTYSVQCLIGRSTKSTVVDVRAGESTEVELSLKVRPPDNPRLAELYQADQADRQAGPDGIDWSIVGPRDEQRREEVLSIIEDHGLRTAGDYHHAAIVFQHGGPADEIRLAFSLAWIASVLDPQNREARWLSAAAWDRIMMREDMPQWYGTNFTKPSADGPWELYKVDESAVTDEERARMYVPPLEAARERAIWMNK